MDSFCPPVIVYIGFLMAIGFYDIYMGKFPNLARTSFYLLFGAAMLWVLCAANMEFAAWMLLMMPILFYTFLIALLVFNKDYTYKVEPPKPREKDVC